MIEYRSNSGVIGHVALQCPEKTSAVLDFLLLSELSFCPNAGLAVHGVEIRCAQIYVHAKIRKFLAYFLIKRIKRYSAELCASAEWLKLLRSFLRKALVFVY